MEFSDFASGKPAEGAKDVLIGLIKIFQVESENTQQYVNIYIHTKYVRRDRVIFICSVV